MSVETTASRKKKQFLSRFFFLYQIYQMHLFSLQNTCQKVIPLNKKWDHWTVFH